METILSRMTDFAITYRSREKVVVTHRGRPGNKRRTSGAGCHQGFIELNKDNGKENGNYRGYRGYIGII